MKNFYDRAEPDQHEFERPRDRETVGHVFHANKPAIIDGPLVIKMLVGAVTLTVIVLVLSVRIMIAVHGEDAEVDPVLAVVIAIASAACGAILGAALALKDRLHVKIKNGEQVGPIMRLLFANGVGSLAVWIVMVFFCGSVLLPIFLIIGMFFGIADVPPAVELPSHAPEHEWSKFEC